MVIWVGVKMVWVCLFGWVLGKGKGCMILWVGLREG